MDLPENGDSGDHGLKKTQLSSCFRQRSSLGLEERDLKNKNLGRNKERTAAFGWNYCNLGI